MDLVSDLVDRTDYRSRANRLPQQSVRVGRTTITSPALLIRLSGSKTDDDETSYSLNETVQGVQENVSGRDKLEGSKLLLPNRTYTRLS